MRVIYVVGLLICFSAVLSGCKTVSHVDELLVLKSLSDAQAEMEDEVEASDAQFEALLEAIDSEAILSYKNQDAMKEAFGLPIFTEMIEEEGRVYQKWLYRYSTQFFTAKKVYLYFDNAGNFIKWDVTE